MRGAALGLSAAGQGGAAHGVGGGAQPRGRRSLPRSTGRRASWTRATGGQTLSSRPMNQEAR